MNLQDFKVLKEDDESYHFGHPSGKSIKIEKKGMSQKAHEIIQKLCMGGGVKGYDEGGGVAPSNSAESMGNAYAQAYGGRASPLLYDHVDVPEDAQGAAYATAYNQKFEQPTPPVVGQNPVAEAPIVNRAPSTAAVNNAVIPDPIAQKQMSMAGAFGEEKAANTQLAKDVGLQGAAESQAIKDTNDTIAKLPSVLDMQKKGKESSDALYKAYESKVIDPNRFWNDKSTGSKVASIFGMLLSGIGAGLSGQKNFAIEALDRAVDKDIDAQKNDQSKSLNAWKMNRESTASDIEATLKTQDQAYTALKYKLAQAQNQFMGPQALDRAKQANALIDQKIAENHFKMALINPTQESMGGGEQGYTQHLRGLQIVAPELYKDAESKYIPNVGVARVPLTAENRTELTAYDALGKNIDKAIDFQKNVAGNMGTWTPENRSQAQALQSQLNVSLGELYNLKRLNDHEYKNYGAQIGDIGSINTGGVVTKLQALKDQLGDRKRSLVTNLGVTPFKKAPADQNAIAWANANPGPKADQILSINGLK